MVDPDDLLSKADALMARLRPERPPVTQYAAIPVLDEVVDRLPERDDPMQLSEHVLPTAADEERTEALAATVRAALLADLQPRIDALIDERLKGSLAPLFVRR